MSAEFGKHTARFVAENESYNWGNLTLAVQLLFPLALVALLFARKKIWIYPYPLLDNYISALCPSFSQQQRLLKWMSSRIPHMNNLPNKITQYWQNGSLLCTLINTVVPGACPNPQKHWRKPPTHGQALAYKYLGVVPILSEDDFSKENLTSYSERKFIKYLLTVQDSINRVTIEEDSLKFTSKYVARGMGLVIGEQNRPSYFYVYPNTGSNRFDNILVNVKGPYNTFGTAIISDSIPCENATNKLMRIGKDNLREQRKLEYKSEAQRSFFRSVSFDIGPIMNLVTNRKNAGEISVKVEIEDERAKVTFLPTFSGIYELLLTSDGQHLQGSPYVIRIMKSSNNKGLVDVLEEKVKYPKGKIERKIIGKSIDFISESVSVTDESPIRLDSNNNNNNSNAINDSNKSDDESVYQDSGIFDVNSKGLSLDEVDREISDESKHDSLEYKSADDKSECADSIIKFDIEKVIVVHNSTPDDVKFLTNDFEERSDIISELIEDENDGKLEEEIFDNADDSRSNQEFENLYNKYVKNEDDLREEISENDGRIIEQVGDNDVDQNLLKNDKKLTSSIERIVEIYESSNKIDKIDASPVFSNIALEAIQQEIPVEDSTYLERDIQLSSNLERVKLSKLTRDYSIYLDDEIYDTNVKEIKNIFEKKPEIIKIANRRFATASKKSTLADSKKKLAKSLPNLVSENGENAIGDDEFLMKFKEKRNFWNNLILQNSTSNLNISSGEIGVSTNAKLISKQYENISQSANSLNTLPRSNKSSAFGKFKRKKDELFKTTSLDLGNSYQDEFHADRIVRVESLYDKIKIFEKDFDSSKHSTLLKRTKERSELKQKSSQTEITKPESLIDLPNTTSNDQIEEDLRFAEIMKERFEMSKRYFSSLEIINAKPNLTRRHSMDSKPSMAKEVPLQKGGSLKVLNVVDKFSLDNIYKDVILNKMKNSSFMGSPNRDAIVETLSSVSSSENNDTDKDNKNCVEEDDLNLQFFNIKKRLRKRRSIKSIFDINY